MRYIVCGGRNFRDVNFIHDVLNSINDIKFLIHGDCYDGVDKIAKDWALKKTGVQEISFPAKWKELDVPGAVIRYGKYGPYNAAAGPQRNRRMLEESQAHALLSFPGGRGTLDMCKAAHQAGLVVRSFGWEFKP